MALEEEFECEIPDEDAEKITSVQQAIDYVDRAPEELSSFPIPDCATAAGLWPEKVAVRQCWVASFVGASSAQIGK